MSTSRRAVHHEEEHENHERWLVSYADMITVLMALFIVLFAISQVDQQKFVELRNGLSDGFGASNRVAVPGGSGILDQAGSAPAAMDIGPPAPPAMAVSAAPSAASAPAETPAPAATPGGGPGPDPAKVKAAAKAEADRFKEIQAQLSAALNGQGLGDRVEFRITDRGLVVAIVADDVFFASASAALQPTGLRVLDTIAPELRPLPEDIAVEGHANNLPIASPLYPTNWELSAARAASVVRHLADDQVTPSRLEATGFGDTRPRFPIGSPQAVAGNRRVDLVIVSNQPAEVRALLPLEAVGAR